MYYVAVSKYVYTVKKESAELMKLRISSCRFSCSQELLYVLRYEVRSSEPPQHSVPRKP